MFTITIPNKPLGFEEAIEDLTYRIDIAYHTNITNKLYLYYKQGKIKAVTFNEHPELPYQLLQAEHIPRNLTCVQLYHYLIERLRKVPCLPLEGK